MKKTKNNQNSNCEITNIIEPFLESDNWFDYQEFYDFVAKKDFQKYVEVGVWKGHSIIYLANKLKTKNVEIFAVDLWDDTYKYDDVPELKKQKKYIYDIYQENVKRAKLEGKIHNIKTFSWQGARYFRNKSVDFVFIDADHSLDSVTKDINAWLPKIRENGIIAGHDYFNPCGVKKAVDKIFGDSVHFYGSCWYVEIVLSKNS